MTVSCTASAPPSQSIGMANVSHFRVRRQRIEFREPVPVVGDDDDQGAVPPRLPPERPDEVADAAVGVGVRVEEFVALVAARERGAIGTTKGSWLLSVNSIREERPRERGTSMAAGRRGPGRRRPSQWGSLRGVGKRRAVTSVSKPALQHERLDVAEPGSPP